MCVDMADRVQAPASGWASTSLSVGRETLRRVLLCVCEAQSSARQIYRTRESIECCYVIEKACGGKKPSINGITKKQNKSMQCCISVTDG